MSTLTNLSREIIETFEFADENPLATNDWLTATNTAQQLDPAKVVDGVAVVTVSPAKAWKNKDESDTPKHADQELRAVGYITGENVLLDALSAASKSGVNLVLTFGTALLKRPIGSIITFTVAGATGFTPTLNATWVGTVISASMVQIATDFSVVGAVTNATISVDDCHFGVMARVDDAVSATSFAPKGGYLARLSFDPADYEAKLYRWERDTGTLFFIKKSSGAVITKNVDMGAAAIDGRGVGQDLRLTVEDEPGGGIRIKVYVNNDDDTAADIDVVDNAENTTKGPGVWGFELGGGGVGIDAWYACDKFRDPGLGNLQAGRMLQELRTDLIDEISRGTGAAVTGDTAFLNRALNRAIQVVQKDLGSLAWWMQREETFQITSSDTRTFELPPKVESVEQFFRATDRNPYGHSIWAIGYNAAGTALVFQSRFNLDGLEVIAQYYAQWSIMLNDTDRSPVRREHDELLVIAAAQNVARRTGDGSWIGALNGYYNKLLKSTKSYLNRQKRQQRTTLRVENPSRDRFSETRYVPDINWLW